MKDQAYSRLYDLAPSPPPPAFHVSKLERRHTRRLKKRKKGQFAEGVSGVSTEVTYKSVTKAVRALQTVEAAIVLYSRVQRIGLLKEKKKTDPVMGANLNLHIYKIHYLFFQLFRARQVSKFARSANMTFKNVFFDKIKGLNFFNFLNGFEIGIKFYVFDTNIEFLS